MIYDYAACSPLVSYYVLPTLCTLYFALLFSPPHTIIPSFSHCQTPTGCVCPFGLHLGNLFIRQDSDATLSRKVVSLPENGRWSITACMSLPLANLNWYLPSVHSPSIQRRNVSNSSMVYWIGLQNSEAYFIDLIIYFFIKFILYIDNNTSYIRKQKVSWSKLEWKVLWNNPRDTMWVCRAIIYGVVYI